MTDGKFGGFQVQVSAFLLVLENAPDQAIDFFLLLLENLLCNFFFKRREFSLIFNLGNRPQATDPFIEFHRLLTPLLEAMTRLDLLVDMIQFRAQAQVLSQAFSLARGIPEITRAVAGMVLVSASAVLLAASGVGLRNDPQAEIAKGGEFLVQPIPSVFEVLQVFGHRASLSGCLLSIKIMGPNKGKVNFYPFLCRTPLETRPEVDTTPPYRILSAPKWRSGTVLLSQTLSLG